MRILSAALVCCLVAGGCQKASDETSAKRMPKPPPPPAREISVPDQVRIEVTVRGKPSAPIDAARLRATPPDFADSERRAWKLATLVGPEQAPPSTEFLVTGAPAAGLLLTQPAGSDEPQPVLMLNRRGELIATLVSPSAPFPPFHGEGGRLHRPGDATPHIGGVTRIQVARPLH
jgi:hypothetical protein